MSASTPVLAPPAPPATPRSDLLDTTATRSRRAGWSRLGPPQLALLGAATAVGPLTVDLYLPALPTLAAEFGSSAAAAQVSVSAAVVGMALGQLVVGPVSDRLGRKAPLVVVLAGFVLATLACAVAPSLGVLVAARAVQGLLAGGAIVVARAVVRDHAAGPALARALAGLFLVVGAGPILAPALGSLLLGVTGWRGVFVALAAFAAAAGVAVLLAMPESLPQAERRPVDARRLARTYGEVLRDRAFLVPAAVSSLAFAGMFAYISAGTFLFQETYGLSETGYGIVFGLTASCVVLGSQIAPRLGERLGEQRVLAGAPLAGLVLGLALVACALLGWASLVVLVGIMMAIFLTMGLALPTGAALALTSQPAHRAGLASGLVGVMQFLVGGLAAPLVGLIDEGSVLVMASVMVVSLAAAAAVAAVGTRKARVAA